MSGEKHDNEKLDWYLLPIKPLEEIIKVLMFGAKKYSANNWMRVTDYKRRYLNAAFRHLASYREGNEKDDESGLAHLAHAGCCILFLLWFDL